MKRPVFRIIDETRHESRVLVLTVLFELAFEPEADLKSRIAEAVRDQIEFVLIDVEQVERIDSAGIGELIRAQAPLREHSHDMHLCNVQPNFRDILRATRLDTVFVIHGVRQDAIDELLARSH